MPHRRFRAPERDGEVLAVPDFAEVPRQVEANRRRLDRTDVVVGGLPLRELRALARREVLEAAAEYMGGSGQSPPVATGGLSAPLLIAGHQPELSHPGVWVKHFALNGLARKLGGTPLHLIVDNDTLKSPALRLPVFRDREPKSVHLQSVPFDKLDGETPYEDRTVHDPELFRTFAERAAPLWQNWGFEPLLPWVWEHVTRRDKSRTNIGDLFAAVRRRFEFSWGCRNLELPVSRLSQTEAFVRFAAHVLSDLPRFRAVYNGAIRAYREVNGVRSANHPAPELGEEDGSLVAPFWVWNPKTDHRRQPISVGITSQGTIEGWLRHVGHLHRTGYNLRPRALTLTLFARVCLGDYFIHGIGGGKYDEVTDAIIRGYFGIEPPAYQVLSATLHLPLPTFPADAGAVGAADRRFRDLHWNPQRHLTPENLTRPEVAALLAERAAVAAHEPPYPQHAARRERFHRLRDITERLRPFVWKQVAPAKAALVRARAEVRANAALCRRDFAWVLYPEHTLRPFLQRFLER
jgi:hypothetical protein